MNKRISNPTTGKLGYPIYQPDRARFLLRAVKAELEKMHGREISYGELGHYTNQAPSTVFNRLQRPQHPAIEGLLCWLERIPEDMRSALIRHACRCLPHLNHPRLNFDAGQVSGLRALLQQTVGLSIITGENDGVRTFILTALGHDVVMSEAGPDSVGGLDRHRPDWFVPLNQVCYFHELKGSCLRTAILDRWSKLAQAEKRLVLLNSVCSAIPDHLGEIRSLAEKCHVVIAEEPGWGVPEPIRPSRAPVNILTVSLLKEERIRVAIQPA